MGISAKLFVDTVTKAFDEKWGYIYATAGTNWTEAKQKNLTAKYNADPDANSVYKLSATKGQKWIGHMVADCSGLVKWALNQNGSTCAHGSNSIWSKYLSEKGKIDKNTTVVPGELVFKLRNGTDYYHVGVYVGDGMVIEAQGVNTGVVKSKLSSWGYHGKLKAVDYDSLAEKETKKEDLTGECVVAAPNGRSVRIRKGPSTSANIAIEIPVGSQVEVLASSEGWAKVEYTVKGYMMTDFLTKKP